MKAMLYRNFLLSRNVLYMAPISAIIVMLMMSMRMPMAICAGTLGMVAYSYILTVFAYEERDNGMQLNKALPVKNSVVVASYYVSLLLALLYATAFAWGSYRIYSAMVAGAMPFRIYDFIVALSLVLVMASVQMPLVLRFGATKMRWVAMMMLLVFYMFVGVVSRFIISMSLRSYGFILILGIAIIILWISYGVSVHLYHKKEYKRYCDYTVKSLVKQSVYDRRT